MSFGETSQRISRDFSLGVHEENHGRDEHGDRRKPRQEFALALGIAVHGVGGDHHGSEHRQDSGGRRGIEPLGRHDGANEKKETSDKSDLGLIREIVNDGVKTRHNSCCNLVIFLF